MVRQVVRLTVSFAVEDQQINAFKSIAQAMTERTQAEPGTIGYEWFTSDDGRQVRLVENYVDAAAIEAHFTGPVVQELLPKLVAVCRVEALEFYGDPGDTVKKKASEIGAAFFQYWIGLNR